MKTLVLPRRRIILAIAVLILGLVGGVGGSLALSWTRADEAEAVADEAESERDEAVAAVEDLCAQVRDLGRICVEDPAEFEGEAGPAGPTGPGPSDDQVYDAVAAYYQEHPNTGEPSPAEMTAYIANYLADHPPGPSKEQVATALAEYLLANPPPAGADGADGTDGSDGAAGPAGPTGPPGPPVSPEELAAATVTVVEEFMAANPLPPRCPDGYEFTAATLLTLDGPPLESVVCAKAGG
jgi:hypothetical protein